MLIPNGGVVNSLGRASIPGYGHPLLDGGIHGITGTGALLSPSTSLVELIRSLSWQLAPHRYSSQQGLLELREELWEMTEAIIKQFESGQLVPGQL